MAATRKSSSTSSKADEQIGEAIDRLEEALGVLALLSNHDGNSLPCYTRAAASAAFSLVREAQSAVIEVESARGGS